MLPEVMTRIASRQDAAEDGLAEINGPGGPAQSIQNSYDQHSQAWETKLVKQSSYTPLDLTHERTVWTSSTSHAKNDNGKLTSLQVSFVLSRQEQPVSSNHSFPGGKSWPCFKDSRSFWKRK